MAVCREGGIPLARGSKAVVGSIVLEGVGLTVGSVVAVKVRGES